MGAGMSKQRALARAERERAQAAARAEAEVRRARDTARRRRAQRRATAWRRTRLWRGRSRRHREVWAIVISLLIVALVIAYAGYTPALAGEIRAIEADGVRSARAAALGKRGAIFAAILAVLVLAILVLMVFKPV